MTTLRTRESLHAWGAPLAETQEKRHYGLHETLLRGLTEALRDGTLLRVLPVVVAKNLERFEWAQLFEQAREQQLDTELGMLLALSGELLHDERLQGRAASLWREEQPSMRFFPEARNEYEAELARQRSPAVARRWGFWMNMSEETFASTLRKHHVAATTQQR